MSTNPLNFRIPEFDLSTEEGRQQAHRWTTQGIVDLNQAIRAFKPGTTTNITNITQGGGGSGGGGSTILIGAVNDQRGAASYTTTQGDNGVKLIVGDTVPVTVNLDPTVTTPWFIFIDNDGTTDATLTPISGSIFGETAVPAGGFGIVMCDGTNFFAGCTALATTSNPGYVVPDNDTIQITGGAEVYTVVTADSGAPSRTPTTPGNPFYFDSSLSPWQGYVWFNNAWNKFQ